MFSRRCGWVLAACVCILARPAFAIGVTPVVVLAGDKDNFASAGDPADVIQLRPGFSSWLGRAGGHNATLHGGQSQPFDLANPDNWDFGYTFTNLPPVCSATLTIHFRAGSTQPSTDGFALQFQDATTSFGWSTSLNSIDAAFGGDGTWNPGEDIAITLNLKALPLGSGTYNLVPLINADGYLDVYVQDDTGIDYIELVYAPLEIHCFQAGIADNYAPPSEPAVPGKHLVAVCDPSRNFDDPVSNSCVGHTFTGLPRGIVCATLEIGIRAGSQSTSNDFLALDPAPGAPTAWQRFLGTTTPPQGPGLLPNQWLPPISNVFQLDLSALPNEDGSTSNILDLLNAELSLDVLVAQDSSVDYIKLCVCVNTCDDEAAPLDPNGAVMFPPELDPTEPITYSDVDLTVGNVSTLYPGFDTSLDDWYAQFPCDPSIGGTVPPEASNPDLTGQLNALGINATPQEIADAFAQWENEITTEEMKKADPLVSAPPLPTSYVVRCEPHCTDPSGRFVFGGRDIIFIHGFDAGPLYDELFGNPTKAFTTWPADRDEFYDNLNGNGVYGYWKQSADYYWNAHINNFLAGRGYQNRYLIVCWPTTQRLGFAVQAVLDQIHSAMTTGQGVVDLSGRNDTSDFGTPSYVIVSHSTGALVADVMLSAASNLPSLNAQHIAKLCKAHVSFHGAIGGTPYATGIMAVAGLASVLQPWLCPLVDNVLQGLNRAGFISTPLSCSNLNIFAPLANSVLVDLIPLVTELRWGPYIGSSPVRTVTVVGGHPSYLAPLKNILQPGFDDGVLCINSMVGNPNLSPFWPSGYLPSFPFGPIQMYDMGIPINRGILYYIDQTLNPIGLAHLGVAAGATPWTSPTGMLQPVGATLFGPWDPKSRYPLHFSYLQSASDHFADSTDENYGYHGEHYRDTGTSTNFEEVRVLTNAQVYSPYSIAYYPHDNQPLLSPACTPGVEEIVKGRNVTFTIKIFGHKFTKTWWIWKRRYHRLIGSDTLVEADYVYGSLLCQGAYKCGDCNGNGISDEEDIASGNSKDCNDNGIPDECDICHGTSLDCNHNGIPDECDIASGHSKDCDHDGVPDECEDFLVLGDLNHDYGVDLLDLAILLSNFNTGTTYSQGDIDLNGVVDLADLTLLLSHYGTHCP